MIDLWLERFPRSALILYGLRRWAEALMGLVAPDDPEWRRESHHP